MSHKRYTFEELIREAKEYREEVGCFDDIMFIASKLVELTNRVIELEEKRDIGD